ncbi:serum amyloid A protein-like [Equus asinus]|uniref:serum amyloid A protein-like n=1 Tax=Equus asinus TaxID=9793 RepID=UPI001D041449|nr:serum amyloid A protein-like [Equus asinus]
MSDLFKPELPSLSRKDVFVLCAIVVEKCGAPSPLTALSGVEIQKEWAWDLVGAYWDMRQANYQHSTRYFHAWGNYDAAQGGPGGIRAAKVISNAREDLQGLLNQHHFGSSSCELENLNTDQKAGEWGQSGNDPKHFRPARLPKEY